MKTLTRLSALMLFLIVPVLSFAQTWVEYEWEEYSTEFKIPSDFEVTESSSEKFSATNGAILMSIYPRTDESLTWEEMENSLRTWTTENEVLVSGDIVELDEEKMNGYWGVLLEGTKNDYNVGTMLIVDPDFTDISLYIWVAYDADQVDTVLEMLMSFTPM
ncbi:MAG: hypothetical protein A2W93_10350 [Bacteroidetes bacterium GWF2_43_63]|nr:MAG: hypothetical protein A2W94_02120 [Bacteroidetes bacterium GWE2_42_42]OFY52922.1 MAG: hypothetical protein A2W93_10350 [Bacteroidetes bacterium GWF2_43_63]HBG70129.1 hypothetical protein [Bacteroidales bacterium]HCB62264.1 hypothetical protein [Bacteroidales bacterium]